MANNEYITKKISGAHAGHAAVAHIHVSLNCEYGQNNYSRHALVHTDSGCGCEHEHTKEEATVYMHVHEAASCGCEQEHTAVQAHIKESDNCGCGHEHTAVQAHILESDDCGCGHEHAAVQAHIHKTESRDYRKEAAAALQTPASEAKSGNKDLHIYTLENLGCANCAAKMEQKIKALPEVEGAVITFATKQLRVRGKHVKIESLQSICSSIENEVVVIPAEQAKKNTKKKENTNITLIAGIFCFAFGFLFKYINPTISNVVFLLSYIILGGKILLTAGKNIIKGQIFDENFLMSIATIGAVIIGDYAEAAGVMLFFRIGEWFEHSAVERSRGQIMDAIDMRPEVVQLVTDDGIKTISASEAKPGHILLIRPGDRIPLDGIITEGESRIDTSPITGEPVPVHAAAGDTLTSGCMNTSGVIKLRVEKPLEESMVTRILESVEEAASSKPKIDRFITKFARIYTPIVVAAALITAIVPSLIWGNWNYWVYTALTFLVISCPCALVLSVPLAFFSGIGAGSKKGILFKGGASLEALSNIKTVVMDKTGTLTKGNFAVQNVISYSEVYSKEELLAIAAASESASTHPIAVSIVRAAKEKGLSIPKANSIKENAGKGLIAEFDSYTVLCGNRKLMQDNGISDGFPAVQGGSTEVYIAIDGKLVGCIQISDTLKSETPRAIQAIKKMGIRTAMLTGDAADSANAIAAKAGIDEVHARLLPDEKLAKLTDIRQRTGAVMFVGDGINDSPVLAGADVGAAMGTGADAAIEAADLVFMTSSMDAVPESISISHKTAAIARQNIIFALVVKAIIMVLGLAGFASMWMAVFADTGVSILCILNSIRILYRRSE